ncbi:MAG: hypothetical protein PHS37_05975, partial [Candidatus Omnitrophica bacterium]|nr:hypothetical protein [Candidatus Omnitrophota bacterium]
KKVKEIESEMATLSEKVIVTRPRIGHGSGKPAENPDITLAIPRAVPEKTRRRIEAAVNRATRHLPEHIEVLFFRDQGSDDANIREAERRARQNGSAMVIPVRRSVSMNGLTREITAGFIDNVVIDLFRLRHPGLSDIDRTREKLLTMPKAEISSIEKRLSLVLPSVVSAQLAGDNLYAMNLRLGHIARAYAANEPLSEPALRSVENDNVKKGIGVTIDNFGELKLIAEQYKNRIKKDAYKQFQIHVTVNVKTAAERVRLESQKETLLSKMDIPRAIINPANVTIETGARGIDGMLSGMRAAGILMTDIVIIDRYAEGRSGIPEGLRLIEYDTVVIPGIIDAALELLARPIGDGNVPGLRQRNSWYLFVPRIKKEDIDALRREINEYERILYAA